MPDYKWAYNSFSRLIIQRCSLNGGKGISKLLRLLELRVFPLIASLESPIFDKKGNV